MTDPTIADLYRELVEIKSKLNAPKSKPRRELLSLTQAAYALGISRIRHSRAIHWRHNTTAREHSPEIVFQRGNRPTRACDLLNDWSLEPLQVAPRRSQGVTTASPRNVCNECCRWFTGGACKVKAALLVLFSLGRTKEKRKWH